jgi:branched-chain amino acid transport system permease protein
MITFAQFLLTGVLVGGAYALLSAGLGLIFGVMRIVNFAQADFMMLAMYVAYLVWAGPRLDPFLMAPLVLVVFAVFGMLIHRTLIVQVTGRRENHDAQVILTLGLGLILQTAVLLTFSSTPKLLALPYARDGWDIGPIYVDLPRLFSFLMAVVVAAGLFLFLKKTMLGRAIRASAENWEAATYMGINIGKVHRLAFGLGIGITALGGIALATFQPLTPFIGLNFIVVMFAAVVLGGLGSIPGAFVGGLLIGVIQSVSQIWSPAALSNVYVFTVFLLVLIFRPQGLFGTRQRVI